MQEILIIGTVLTGLIIILAYIYIAVKPVLPYLYINTMLQSRSGKFLSKKKLQSLIESKNLNEFVNNLTDTFYEVDDTELESMHHAFTHKYAELLTEIKKNTPKEFTELLNTYALLAESAIIRYLYRSKFLGKAIDDTYVYEVGTLSKYQLSAMKSAVDFAEFKAMFSPTIYRKLLLTEHKSVEEFENAMDLFISDEIENRLKQMKIANKKLIRDLFKMIIDQHNIMTAFQSIIRQAPVQLMKGGFVDIKLLEDVKSANELLEKIENTIYSTTLNEVKSSYEKTGRTAYFEIALERLILSIAQKEVMSKPQGAFSIFVFILKARQDKQNVQIISKGIEAGLKIDKIEEMII